MPTGIYKRTKEHGKKISDGLLGHSVSKATRIKMSNAGKGKIVSKKTRKKISEANKERFKDKTNHPRYGKHLSEETKRKISMSEKGKKMSKEARRKISEALKGRQPKNSLNWRGENHPSWRGGITPKHVKIRGSIQYRLWREAVFARDNWTCQKTGKRGGELISHHIKNFAQYPELRFAIDNGITFSEEAHNEFHRIYGRKNNNEKQIDIFLEKKESCFRKLVKGVK